MQSGWVVPDPLLRRNLKDAIAEDFLPFYLAFFNRYKVHRAILSSHRRQDPSMHSEADPVLLHESLHTALHPQGRLYHPQVQFEWHAGCILIFPTLVVMASSLHLLRCKGSGL